MAITSCIILQNSLTELMEKMNASKPRFIRCIKPNMDKMPDNFISHYVQKQLQYTGVMETARIRQCGFPTRLTFDDFCKRYNCVCMTKFYLLRAHSFISGFLLYCAGRSLPVWDGSYTIYLEMFIADIWSYAVY